jgi:DNA-binding response OmpR family regulator
MEQSAMNDPPLVLVVEDDEHIRDLVVLHLKLEGFGASTAEDGQAALRLANERPFDLVILDLMIPLLDGVTVCRAIRHGTVNRDVPILMLTARREESDKVLGLENGADDYLTKPFGVRELVARVRALLRRRRGIEPVAAGGAAASASGAVAETGVIRTHGVEIDDARRRVRVGDHEVPLTNQEFQLLQLLASHPGIVFSREALLARIWKGETFVTERSVDTLVKRLRHKIEDDVSNPRLVLTVWGVGYKFADV